MAKRDDQILRYGIDVASNKPLLEIAQGLDKIVEAGGPAAEEARALGEQLKLLAEQGGIARSLVADKAALQETGDALALTKIKVQELQTAFDSTAAPTAALTRNLEAAKVSVTGLEGQYNRLGASILAGENALRAAGVDTANLDSAQRGLQASLSATSAKGAALATSFKEVSAAAKEESLTLAEITERNAVLRNSFEQLRDLLKTFAGLFALEKIGEELHGILETGDKFTKWGIQFSNAFGGTEKGQEALEGIKRLAEETPLSLDEIAKAALQAKKVGLDPLDGSLQALINTTLKFGGNSADLESLITALGKSANQGGLNLRTLIALEQQGIPAAKLLGEEIGKTAEQVTELAKSGKLGTDSVQTLIAALGKANTGAIAEQMGLLSTQTTKAKDNFDEFLNLISKSGAYEFVRDQLQQLNLEFKKGLEDGSLQESAKAISDGLIKVGQALLSITKFAAEHAGAILTVTEKYLEFKAVMLGLDLLGAAQKFLALGEATKAAGAAAAAASAEGGFGKLGAAINRIPKTIQIAVVAAGVSEVVSQAEELIDLTLKIRELNKEVAEQHRDDATLQAELLEKTKAVAAQTKAAAETEVASADQLAQKNREQSQAYIESLQNAIRYFTAIRIQDQAIGNASGAKVATEKLRELVVALQEATDHERELAESIHATSERVSAAVDRFDDLRTRGVAAATAIQGAFDNIDLSNPRGLQTAINIIQQLSIRSREAKEAVGAELLGAISKLNDADLRAFQENVSARLKEAKGDADALKLALGGALQEELTRLGLTAEQAGIKFTAAGQAIITSFEGVAANAKSTGEQIQLAFAQAISKATTTGEIQQLQRDLENAFKAGRISAEQFGTASEAAGRRLAAIQVGATTASASLDGMGKAGETSAQRISNALQATRDKLVVQANQIARAITDALSGGDNAKADALRAQFKAVDTQIQSLNGQINELTPSFSTVGDTGSDAGRQIAQGWDQATESIDNTRDAAGGANDALAKTGHTAGDLNETISRIGSGGFPDLTKALANTRAQFLGISEAAAAAFDRRLIGDFFSAFDSTGIGFARVIQGMNEAAAATTKEIEEQRTALAQEITGINELGIAADTNFGAFGDAAGGASERMRGLADLIAQGKYQMGLLGQQDLGPLQQALEAAAQRADALAQAASNALQSIADKAQQAQDEIDQLEGNPGSIEDRRHAKAIADIQAEAKVGGAAAQQAARQAIDNENKLHELKLKNIQDQQKKSQGGSSDNASGSTVTPSNPSSGSSGGLAFFGNQQPHVINVHLGGAVILGSDPATTKAAITKLAKEGLDDLARRTAGPLFPTRN